MKLNLGCCDRHQEGFVNVDIDPPADQIVDLSVYPWPWADSSVEEIIADDVIEHLPCKRSTMNELWRVLKPGGTVKIQVPHATDGDGGHCDPTHKSFWTASDFEYYAKGVAERERFRDRKDYSVKADFKLAGGRLPTLTRYERLFGGHVVEITVVLEAVK